MLPNDYEPFQTKEQKSLPQFSISLRLFGHKGTKTDSSAYFPEYNSVNGLAHTELK